jgi:hypothetical protein
MYRFSLIYTIDIIDFRHICQACFEKFVQFQQLKKLAQSLRNLLKMEARQTK